MAIMKLCLMLLLCMLAMRQCIPCEASRKMLMELEEKGDGESLQMSRKISLEEGEEATDMETELMLPDETENEKLDIEQQDPLEKLEKKKKKQHKEDESMFPESGDGDLLLEGNQGEAAGEIAQEKKKKKEYGVGERGKIEVSREQESTGQLTGENLQEEGKGEKKLKKKARNDMEELSITGQTLEEDPSFEMGKEGDEVEGLSGEASLSDIVETEMETRGGAFPSELADGGGNTFKEKLQTEEESSDVVFTPSEHQTSTDDSQQNKEEDAKEKSLKPKKSKKEEVGAVKATKKISDADEVLKSKVQDDKAVKGEAVAEQITDELTPADVIEREMQGGDEDLATKAVEEDKLVEEKQQAKEEAGTTWMKQQGSLDESKRTDGGKAKKKFLKKPKAPKQPKSEFEVPEEEDAESKGSRSIDNKDMETKVKQEEESANSNSPSELLGDSIVKAGETSESQSKQVGTQDTAKPKKKKKKVKLSEKPKEEEKSSKKNEKKETPNDDNETEEGTKNSKISETKRAKKMPKSEISSKVAIDANPEEDTSKKQESQVENPLKGTEDELPTIEKQEEKFQVEVQSIVDEAQERPEGLVSATESLSSSAQGVDEDDDEYGDFLQDFSDFSTKFQDTAMKVADHLGPNIQKLTDTSKVYFNKANQQITESFSPVVGKQFAPFLASLVSYGLLLVPLAVVIFLFEHIRALLSLQKVLLFVNIYLAAYFATLLLATFIMGEPMNYFYKSSASGYVHLQLLQALAYIIYLILQSFDLVFTCTSETLPVKVTVVLQWLVAFTVGFHYYVTVFHRAVTLKGPHTNWKIYGIYSIAFLVLCLFARIKRVKKGYSQLGQADTDKKH